MQYQVQHCGTFFRDYYFTAVSWVRSDAVAVIWMNRAQNISLVTECSPPTWICRIVSKIFFGRWRFINENAVLVSSEDMQNFK